MHDCGQPDCPLNAAITDRARLDWLEANFERLIDVRWRIVNEGDNVRQAIDALMALNAERAK